MARRRCRLSGCLLFLTCLSVLLLRVRSFVPSWHVDCHRNQLQSPRDCTPPSLSHNRHTVLSLSLAASSPPSSLNNVDSGDDEETPPRPRKYKPRRPQVRLKPKYRRPKNYWLDVTKIDRELRQLWASHSIDIPHNQPPPIPNESLLNHWKRHDIRAAIVTHNGRDELADALGGSVVIPGRWKEAVETPIVKRLIELDPMLNAEVPPLSPQQVREGKQRDGKKLRMRNRKEPGYWSMRNVIRELFEFLEIRRQQEMLPSVWMPRLSDIKKTGRTDLHSAIQRVGGDKLVCRIARLVPYREWNYIEGLHDTMVELKKYLDEHQDGDYSVFPIVSHLKVCGYERLHHMIQFYGGRKFLASRLGMEEVNTRARRNNKLSVDQLEGAGMNWGSFDLTFGIELLAFVRNEQMKKRAPLKYPSIEMPSKAKLLASGERGFILDRKIELYGGYENVARRLGLAYFIERPK